MLTFKEMSNAAPPSASVSNGPPPVTLNAPGKLPIAIVALIADLPLLIFAAFLSAVSTRSCGGTDEDEDFLSPQPETTSALASAISAKTAVSERILIGRRCIARSLLADAVVQSGARLRRLALRQRLQSLERQRVRRRRDVDRLVRLRYPDAQIHASSGDTAGRCGEVGRRREVHRQVEQAHNAVVATDIDDDVSVLDALFDLHEVGLLQRRNFLPGDSAERVGRADQVGQRG